MTGQLVALGIFVVVFGIAAARNVNIGIVLFPVAAVVGLWLADMTLELALIHVVDAMRVAVNVVSH